MSRAPLRLPASTASRPSLPPATAGRANGPAPDEPASERSTLAGPARGATPSISAAVRVVVVASSTGGPEALAQFLTGLPATFALPIVVAQHAPPGFSTRIAAQLDRLGRLRVREAVDGMPLAPGMWIAPSDGHTEIHRRGTTLVLAVRRGPPIDACRPSATVLFRSAANVRRHVLGIVLTGMGNDGEDGAAAIRASGGTIWAQDEASSSVWGMPGAVVRAGSAQRCLALDSIAPELVRFTTEGAKPR